MSSDQPGYDLLAVGEVLIDFISTKYSEDLQGAAEFQRMQGGSPANLAVNITRLGGKAALASRAGEDGFGRFLKANLEKIGVDTRYLILDQNHQTSLVFVAKTTGTPDFQPYRSADYQITSKDIPETAITDSRIIHTTTWPLSLQPSRTVVLDVLKMAQQKGKIVSLDPNFSPKVWQDVNEARKVLAEAFNYVTLTKASLDDSRRLFGGTDTPEAYIQRYHDLGPSIVVFTQGKEGSIVSQNGVILERLPARSIDVVDATGAGDSFWAGFLIAYLDGMPLDKCLRFAREVVEIKLRTVGTLPPGLTKEKILSQLQDL
jgi:fructokinase